MKASQQQCYAALEDFKKVEREATQKYAQFWQDFFRKYGFTALPCKHPNYSGSFSMKFGNTEFHFFCLPSHYQGVKIQEMTIGALTFSTWHKVMTENGAENWMRRSGFGRPPI